MNQKPTSEGDSRTGVFDLFLICSADFDYFLIYFWFLFDFPADVDYFLIIFWFFQLIAYWIWLFFWFVFDFILVILENSWFPITGWHEGLKAWAEKNLSGLKGYSRVGFSFCRRKTREGVGPKTVTKPWREPVLLLLGRPCPPPKPQKT